MWPELDPFKPYRFEFSAAEDPDDEHEWRAISLNRIVGGKAWREVSYADLYSYYDCLDELDPSDFHKLFVCIVAWHQAGEEVEELVAVLLRRMGFLDRMKDFSSTRDIARYAGVFAMRRQLKEESRSIRYAALAACPGPLAAAFRTKEPLWRDVFVQRQSDYLFRLFWRWYKRNDI